MIDAKYAQFKCSVPTYELFWLMVHDMKLQVSLTDEKNFSPHRVPVSSSTYCWPSVLRRAGKVSFCTLSSQCVLWRGWTRCSLRNLWVSIYVTLGQLVIFSLLLLKWPVVEGDDSELAKSTVVQVEDWHPLSLSLKVSRHGCSSASLNQMFRINRSAGGEVL